MAPNCKGRCTLLKTEWFEDHQKYQNGYRYCKVCSRFIKTNVLRCLCCNNKLRVRAKNGTRKAKNEIESCLL